MRLLAIISFLSLLSFASNAQVAGDDEDFSFMCINNGSSGHQEIIQAFTSLEDTEGRRLASSLTKPMRGNKYCLIAGSEALVSEKNPVCPQKLAGCSLSADGNEIVCNGDKVYKLSHAENSSFRGVVEKVKAAKPSKKIESSTVSPQ